MFKRVLLELNENQLAELGDVKVHEMKSSGVVNTNNSSALRAALAFYARCIRSGITFQVADMLEIEETHK